MEHTQEELEKMVAGTPSRPVASFHEHARLNVERSRQAGHRVYDKLVYIKLSQPGVRDSVSYEAKPADIRAYPNEYQYFLQNRQGTKTPGVEIIPNLDIAHLQELLDMGLLTIPQLATVQVIPPHLEYARRAAILFNQALQEMNHAEEEGHEEDSGQEGQAEAVLASDRQEHRGHVEQREFPSGIRRQEVEGRPEGNAACGRKHRGVTVDEWSMEFRVR